MTFQSLQVWVFSLNREEYFVLLDLCIEEFRGNGWEWVIPVDNSSIVNVIETSTDLLDPCWNFSQNKGDDQAYIFIKSFDSIPFWLPDRYLWRSPCSQYSITMYFVADFDVIPKNRTMFGWLRDLFAFWMLWEMDKRRKRMCTYFITSISFFDEFQSLHRKW